MRVPLLLLILLAGGCVNALPPQDVADRYWRSVVTRHPDKLKRYVCAAEQGLLADAAALPPVTRYALGTIVIEDDRARIETRVVLDGPEALEIPLTTQLLRDNDRWCVEHRTTVSAITSERELAEVMRQIEAIGETLKHGIDRSVDDLKNALPRVEEEIARFESEFKQRLPELREKIEEFRKRFEESIEKRPAEPPPAADGTIEI